MARANWFRNALIDRGIQPCIPSRKNRLVQIPHDTVLYRQCHRIENMCARIKDWSIVGETIRKPIDPPDQLALAQTRTVF